MDTTVSVTGYRLRRLRPADAEVISGWVADEEELRWLAPGTAWPLTAAKVAGWRKRGGEALVFGDSQGNVPVCYGELNPMRRLADGFWLGHIVVHPELRGRGLGTWFVGALLAHAFDSRRAVRICLIVFPENVAAIRCYRRVGFARAGEERHRFTPARGRERLLRFEIGREAWLAGEASEGSGVQRTRITATQAACCSRP